MTPEERRAKLRATAEKLKKEREEEKLKDKAHYQKLTSGIIWKIFTFFTFFCVVFAGVITYDTFFDGETKPLSRNGYRFDRSLAAYGSQSIWVDENIFTVPFSELGDFDPDSFSVTYSPILGDEKLLNFVERYEDSVTPLELRYKSFYKRISIYEYFPFVQILLLLPLLVFLFKRQQPWFKFALYTCFLLIFPGSIILLLTTIF